MLSGDCNACINVKMPSYSATCVECGLSRKNYKPITNADRLRTMSVEEMAEFLEMIPHCGNPPTYTMDGFCIDDGLRTKKQWLDWLRQEAVE